MLQSFLCVLHLLYHFYVFYCYSGCHADIGNFNAKNFDAPHIAQIKNYLEPKNYF